MLPETFKCLLVDKDAAGNVTARVTRRPMTEQPDGEVTIRVDYSSLNYKDALAATGHPGVVQRFPHVPGVDAVGHVVESGVFEAVAGDAVITTGFDLGADRWGGYTDYLRVPFDWIVPLPAGLAMHEAMILGTAGLTAALCIDALEKHDVRPDSGPVVVTGASGGVGSMAVAILSKLGYHVAAVTGKTAAHDYLHLLGAKEILPREAVDDRSGKPLLSGRWAGAVDTVGGNMLGTVIRGVQHGGCVTACGLAGGNDLPITVYPFILRGVTLTGVDAAWCNPSLRHLSWKRLAGPWKPDCLGAMASYTTLENLMPHVADILAGRVQGRVVVEIGARE